jgi:hypothetical protein
MSLKEGTAMKSMLASMAVVLTFCAAPAVSAEFPKTGSAEYDTYYVDHPVAKIDSAGGTGKYNGITGTVPYTVVKLHDTVGGYGARIVNHKATWQIK